MIRMKSIYNIVSVIVLFLGLPVVAPFSIVTTTTKATPCHIGSLGTGDAMADPAACERCGLVTALPVIRRPKRSQATKLGLGSPNDEDEENGANGDGDSDSIGTNEETKQHKDGNDRKAATSADNNNEVKKSLSRFLLNVNFAFGYAMTALGVLLSIGLLLNLLGYGYQITPQGELRIDTIGHLREEAQFRSEVKKSMKEYKLVEENEMLQKSAVDDDSSSSSYFRLEKF